eukprot:COSAG01_NODE_3147_length_6515_cov_3.711347_12_plen_104_part_00
MRKSPSQVGGRAVAGRWLVRNSCSYSAGGYSCSGWHGKTADRSIEQRKFYSAVAVSGLSGWSRLPASSSSYGCYAVYSSPIRELPSCLQGWVGPSRLGPQLAE